MNNKIIKRKLPLVTTAFLVVLGIEIIRAVVLFFMLEIKNMDQFLWSRVFETVVVAILISALFGLVDYNFRIRKRDKKDPYRVSYLQHLWVFVLGMILLLAFPLIFYILVVFNSPGGV